MNAVSDLETVNRYARLLEDTEAQRLGLPIKRVRPEIARHLGISVKTLENYRYLRTKVVPNWLMAKVRKQLIDVLQLEMQRLEHEINLARQAGRDNRDDDLASAQAHVAATRQILEAAK